MTPDQARLSQAQAVCREIYAETQSFYDVIAPQMEAADLGFRVLYGPPMDRPRLLFLGYQPGGRDKTEGESHHERWPERCDYADATWPLARRIRDVWGCDAVQHATGLNAVFFRSPTVRAWRELPVWREAENFSISRAERIVRLLAPQRIIVIGLGTFDLLQVACGDVPVRNGDRILVKQGELWGSQAFGVIHLSGARVSKAEIAMLRTFFSEPNSN